ncbi:hypothetical protein BDZ89DRAFT_961082 [Hymenopellis radicata]|nr:hypothetical protein BDZ89DRAFT_961082 [Hymenopellis radicata]
MKAANFRRLLNSSSAPALQAFKHLLEKATTGLAEQDLDTFNDSAPDSTRDQHANYTYCGTIFSRASTHLGNSLVQYRVDGLPEPVAGSIERIRTDGDRVVFDIRRQAQLPHGQNDPFKPYPWFPATTYSSHLQNVVDRVSPNQVIGHVARFVFSESRCVILDITRVCGLTLLH